MDIAILGNGFMGKKHKAVINNIPFLSLIAEIDPNLAPHSSHNFQSIEDFIGRKISCDLVLIATPNHLHFIHAKTLLQNGYNVLIEKPFCFHKKEADELHAISKETGKKIYLVMQNRFSSVSQYLKEIISTDQLGEIYNIQFNAFWNRGNQYYQPDSWKGKKNFDGGVLYTQFSHLIDLLFYTLNNSFKVSYKSLNKFRNTENSEIEDSAILILEAENKAKIIINFTTAVFEKNQETSLNIIAEKGTLKIAGQYFNEVVYRNITGEKSDQQLQSTSNEENLESLYLEILKDFDGKANTSIQIEEGLSLINILDEIYA